MPKLKADAITQVMDLNFIRSFKKSTALDTIKEKTEFQKPAQELWIWDEDVVPLSEQNLVKKENLLVSKYIDEWEDNRHFRQVNRKRVLISSKIYTP